MPSPLPAYKGNDPYVFVSYSHADEGKVYAEIRRLQDKGVHVWYDTTGIGAGAEWNEEIARAIRGAACFCYFITPESVRSEHCRRELNFAQSHEKRIVAVHVEETEVPDGLRLSLDNRQALFSYQMDSTAFQQALLLALTEDSQPPAAEPTKAPNHVRSRAPWRWSWAAVASLAIVILVAAAWLSLSTKESKSTPGASIAVLPLIDLSPRGDQQHIGDGIAEEILARLTGLEGLRVAARSSSFAFREREEDLRSIAETLDVSAVLEGSLRRDGDRIRVTAQLIDTMDGFHLWARTYERELTDLFSIQTDIAEAVAGSLGVTLGVGNVNAFSGAGTDNIDAYEAYLQARRARASKTERIRLLQRAVKLDPNYAAAWAELGLTVASTMWEYPPKEAPSIINQAVPHLNRAVALEPESAYAKNLLATVNYATFDWIRSERFIQQALAVSPDARSLLNYSNLLMRAGRTLEAIETREAALRTGYSESAGRLYIYALLAAERFDQARLLLEGLPAHERASVALLIALNEGNASAVRTALAGLTKVEGSQLFASVLREFSDPVRVRATLAAAYDDPTEWPSKLNDIALLAAYFDDPELSLQALSVEFRLTTIRLGTLWYPVMRGVRSLEASKELLNDLNLPVYWRAFGWSDHCRPTSDPAFECF